MVTSWFDPQGLEGTTYELRETSETMVGYLSV